MAPTYRFRLGSLDLSSYCRMNPDDKFDPLSQSFEEPAFTDTPFSDGQPLLSTTIHNREQMIPLFVSAPGGPSVTNLVPDPGFEYDAPGGAPAGWAATSAGWGHGSGGATLTVVSTNPQRGEQCLQIVTTAVANEQAVINLGTLPAGTYTLSMQLLGAAGGEAVQILAGESATDVSGPMLTLSTAWQQATLAFTSDGANPSFISVRGNAAAAITFYMDSVICAAGAAVPHYADGDTGGWVWSGAPGQSTSSSVVGKDGLHQLIRQIKNAAQQRPLTVEWRDDSASASTFFDVQFVRFEPDFNFRRSQHGYAAGILHVWTTGYGHTGTTRVTATAAGTGIFLSVPIGSVAGDAPALMDTTIVDGGVVPSLGRIVALAPIQNPSYTPQIPAASLTDTQPGASLIGASGADGSQYLALPVSPTGGASGVACKVPLPNPTIAGGDNRILAVVKAGIDAGIGITALDPYGNLLGPTAVASMSQSWGVVDLGVCRLPTVGYPTLPKISIQAGALYASGAPGPLILASPGGLALNEVFCLPDKNLTLILESGVGGSVLSKDAFAGARAQLLGQNDNVGNPWQAAQNHAHQSSVVFMGSQFGAATGAQLTESLGYHGGPGVGQGAEQIGTLAMLDADSVAGVLSDAMAISAKVAFASPGLGFEEVRLFKDVQPSQFVQARLAASRFLSLEAATGAAIGNVLASVSVGALTAGAKYRLYLNLQGPAGFVSVSQDNSGALLASIGVASNAAIAGAGNPALAMSMPSNALGAGAGVGPRVSSWEVDTIGSSNLLPYDNYRIDGINSDTYRTSSAGVFSGQKLNMQMRGAFPKMAPSTTSVAVIAAAFDQGPANDLISAAVSVKERFSYAR